MQSLVVAPFAITEGAGVWPIVIGGGILVLLLAAMLVLLGIGRGREHS